MAGIEDRRAVATERAGEELRAKGVARHIGGVVVVLRSAFRQRCFGSTGNHGHGSSARIERRAGRRRTALRCDDSVVHLPDGGRLRHARTGLSMRIIDGRETCGGHCKGDDSSKHD
ncbi:hypothetical protein D3C81_906330 [compost metagenome]